MRKSISTRTLVAGTAAAALAAGLALPATASGSTPPRSCTVTVTYLVLEDGDSTASYGGTCHYTGAGVRQLERLDGNPPGFHVRRLAPQHGTWQVAVWGWQPGVSHLRNPSSCLVDGAGGAFGS